MLANTLILDSVTKLPKDAAECVAYCASHGGHFCAAVALQAGLRAVILCDAGVGLRQAGIAALEELERAGLPAATVDYRTARIGDGQDGYQRGRLSYTNAVAASMGVSAGDSCKSALEVFAREAPRRAPYVTSTTPEVEHRSTVALPNGGRVVLVDSNSLIRDEDKGEIVVCGSHGGLLGGKPESAVRVDVGAILFNDANVGADDAGLSRLPALDARCIPAGCVSAWTARIGDGLSCYQTGVVSALNETALRSGAMLGMSAQEFSSHMWTARMPR